MTILIADNSPRISYTATSGQTAFTVPFEFFDNSDLNVYINDTLKTLTTHYTVTGGDGSTGSITLVTGATAGDVVVITRDVTIERTTDFPSSGPFQVASLNTELDKVVAMIADMNDLADRGLRLSDSDTSATLVLADKDTRKGTVLAFNATTGAVEVGPTIADTNSVAQIKADIATVAGISTQVTTVSGISSQVTTVANNDTNVTTVAGQATNMQNITDNLTAVQNAATNATTASTKATEAAASATAAATSETNAGTSETNAATSATNASTSATAASTSATAAASSATAAAASETAAAASETAAGTSETNASTSATTATTKASEASTSATNAAASATSAASAQSAAESARDSALAAYDNFDDRYLGAKSSDPTVDNDGNALVAGALYFDTTSETMKVYTGSAWVAAYVSGTDFAALSGATFTGSVTMPTVDINGGAIDGTIVGGSSAAAGTFTTLTASSDLTVDTNTLHVDSTNNRVGIGTTSPDRLLTLQGDNSYMWIKDAGGGNTAFIGSDGTNDGWLRLYDSSHNAKVEIESDGVTYFNGGNVGIGNSSPDTNLEISDTSGGVLRLSGTTGGGSGATPYDIGSIEFKSDDDSVGAQRVVATVKTEAATASTIPGGELVFETRQYGSSTTLTERMRIDSSGNVGIGTDSPAQLLHLRSATPAIEFDDSGFSTVRGRIYSDEGNLLLEADYNSARNSSNIEMKVDNVSRFRIESNGRVRVGSSSTDSNAAFEVNNINYYLYPIYRLSSDTYNPRFAVFKRASGTEVGSIRFTTSPYTGVTYNTTSDYRLKENVVGITDGITRVKQLNPRRFNFIGESDGTIDGFLAHEVSPAVPEAVSGTHNETRPIGDITDTEGNVLVSDTQEPPELDDGQTWTETGTEPVYQEIDHSRLVPLLTAALQEAIAKIETLETKVAALEAE